MEVLPGDLISPTHIPKSSKKQLKIGPGLLHTPPSTIAATVAGEVQVDQKKNAIWTQSHSKSGRYVPRTNELVIGQVHHSSAETFHVSLSPNSPFATLPQLAFDSATKKTRPNLSQGDLVYARICSPPSKYLDAVELECFTVSPTTGVSDAGLGPLKGGTVVDVSLGFARRLMMGAKRGGVVVLELLGERVGFEIAVGRNGRIWIGGDDIKVLIVVSRVLKEADIGELDEKQQKALVGRLLKEFTGS